MTAVAPTPAQITLLTRRRSRINSVFELDAPHPTPSPSPSPPHEPTTAPPNALTALKRIFTSRRKSFCVPRFEGHELLLDGVSSRGSEDEAKKKGAVNGEKVLADATLYRCDLRTTKIKVEGPTRKRKGAIKIRFTDPKGRTRKMYASSPSEAAAFMRAVNVERCRAIEDDDHQRHHGKILLDTLRARDVSNRLCADCQTPDPEWISYHKIDKTASLVCLECAGHHRFLGVDKVFVQSLILDSKSWIPGSDLHRLALASVTNGELNKLHSSRGVPKRRASVLRSISDVAAIPDSDQRRYIEEKYVGHRHRNLTSQATLTVDGEGRDVDVFGAGKGNYSEKHVRRRTVDVEMY